MGWVGGSRVKPCFNLNHILLVLSQAPVPPFDHFTFSPVHTSSCVHCVCRQQLLIRFPCAARQDPVVPGPGEERLQHRPLQALGLHCLLHRGPCLAGGPQVACESAFGLECMLVLSHGPQQSRDKLVYADVVGWM